MNNEKIFYKFFKRHQKTTIGLLLAIIVFVSEVSVSYLSNSISVIQNNRDKIRDNEEVLSSLSSSVSRNKSVIQNIVTRESFNAYIRRIDEERHSQVSINNENNRDIGLLTGRLDILEKIIYENINKGD
ncbi:hypothetical protein [uncultured Paraglaciecola sp.]|uniref:hypothetical protein n=1 Tax=uncultured Paraglaciecola sp. TaxID=1765024 RepID=UPI00261AAE32|nr:hypothetical protein [uncultured Paraglaciecola sp.]